MRHAYASAHPVGRNTVLLLRPGMLAPSSPQDVLQTYYVLHGRRQCGMGSEQAGPRRAAEMVEEEQGKRSVNWGLRGFEHMAAAVTKSK